MLPANVLFIDDNPRELAEVQAAFPTINVCGDNHYLWRQEILYSPATQVAQITDEGAARTSLIQGRRKREASRASTDRDEWLASLDLALTVRNLTSASDPDFTRVLELLNKTNQFNTTGRRWTHAELGQLLAEGGSLVVAALRDRFVDNGLIGVVVVKDDTIEQGVLSCRVFGLDVELAMFKAACDLILTERDKVIGTVVETESNFVCRDIYRRLGFTSHGEVYVATSSPAAPPWIQLHTA